MKMQETGCGRSLLPGQQSPSPLFVSHGLGTDGTLLPHGRHYRDLQMTSGKDPKGCRTDVNAYSGFMETKKSSNSVSMTVDATSCHLKLFLKRWKAQERNNGAGLT